MKFYHIIDIVATATEKIKRPMDKIIDVKKRKRGGKIEMRSRGYPITLSTRQISHLSVAALKIEY